GQEHAQVTESAKAVEDDQALGEILLLVRDARLERRDLRLDGPALVVEARLHVDGQRELARADSELEIDRLQLLLRRLRLPMNVVESRFQLRDLAADAVEIGVTRGLRVRAGEHEQRRNVHADDARRS